MIKKIVTLLLTLVATIVFILIPLPASDLYIRIYFDEITGPDCNLYYATDSNGFSADQYLTAPVDYDTKSVTFRLDGSLEGHLDNLRVDFSAAEALICVKTITVSSAGVIQDEYNPCDFFAPHNAIICNDTSLNLVNPTNRTYISTGAGDPYIVFSDGLTDRIENCYSHFHLTRILLCLLAAGGYLLTKANIFGEAKS